MSEIHKSQQRRKLLLCKFGSNCRRGRTCTYLHKKFGTKCKFGSNCKKALLCPWQHESKVEQENQKKIKEQEKQVSKLVTIKGTTFEQRIVKDDVHITVPESSKEQKPGPQFSVYTSRWRPLKTDCSDGKGLLVLTFKRHRCPYEYKAYTLDGSFFSLDADCKTDAEADLSGSEPYHTLRYGHTVADHPWGQIWYQLRQRDIILDLFKNLIKDAIVVMPDVLLPFITSYGMPIIDIRPVSVVDSHGYN